MNRNRGAMIVGKVQMSNNFLNTKSMGMGMGMGKNIAMVQAKPNPPAFTTKPVVGGRASGPTGKPIRQSVLGLSKQTMA